MSERTESEGERKTFRTRAHETRRKKGECSRARRREKERRGRAYDGVRYRRRGGLSRKGERETIQVEKGAVREGERGKRERERKRKKEREERRTEASGRLNNIIGGVLTVPGRPRANSSPLFPHSAPLLRLILSSRSPWPPLTPPRVSFAHAGPSRRAPRSRLSPAGGTERHRLSGAERGRGCTKGSGVISRSLTVTVDAVPSLSLSLSAPPPSLFSSLRRGPPALPPRARSSFTPLS